jgi:hypothetical protein
MRNAVELVERIEEEPEIIEEPETDPVEDRAITIIRRLRDIDRQIAGLDASLTDLATERRQLSEELTDIACIAAPVMNESGTRHTRKCGLCDSYEHISRNGKCPRWPNGKPADA